MANGNERPLVLAILDGWGFSQKTVGNPTKEAKTPVLDQIDRTYPKTLLQASGPAVGMEWGESGNSEVGHLTIGAGRIIEQYHSRINRSIKDGTFFTNEILAAAFAYAREYYSRVHIIGLLTSGTVHAALAHATTLIELAARNNQTDTFFHLFLDGRDSGLQEGVNLLAKLNDEIKRLGVGKIVTLIGRDFAMDRDNNWERTQRAFNLIANATGENSLDFTATLTEKYQSGINDSAIPPLVNTQMAYDGLRDNDVLIFFNFREDSMRQIFRSFSESEFSFFKRPALPKLYLVSMTQYLDNQTAGVAFPRPTIKLPLTEVVSLNGLAQIHIAETDKYAHVTYFLNGLRGDPFPGETDIFVDSAPNIEQTPAMASGEITTKTLDILENNPHNFIILNFANGDLLAHTGNYQATVGGLEAIDAALGQLQQKVLEKNGILIITADHGNAELLVYKSSGEAETKHESNPVFFYLIASEYQTTKTTERFGQESTEINGILADIAPTILALIGLPKPDEMTGQSLLPILGPS